MNKSLPLFFTLFTAIAPISISAQNVVLASAESVKSNRILYAYGEKRLERAIEAYQRGLNHTIPAIIESAMFNLLVLKIDYPDMDFTSSLTKLDELSLHGKTSVVRYKAHVTAAFIKNPTLFLDVESSEFDQYMDVEKADHFYLALSKALQNQLSTVQN